MTTFHKNARSQFRPFVFLTLLEKNRQTSCLTCLLWMDTNFLCKLALANSDVLCPLDNRNRPAGMSCWFPWLSMAGCPDKLMTGPGQSCHPDWHSGTGIADDVPGSACFPRDNWTSRQSHWLWLWLRWFQMWARCLQNIGLNLPCQLCLDFYWFSSTKTAWCHPPGDCYCSWTGSGSHPECHHFSSVCCKCWKRCCWPASSLPDPALS